MVTKDPSKQRKRLYNLPLHKKRKLVAAPLSKELKEKHGKRSVPIRKGDEVVVARGDRKGQSGKVREVDYQNQKIRIEGITIEKADKSETMVSIHPSNLMIINLDLSDEKRIKMIER